MEPEIVHVRRRQERAVQTRSKILDAALVEFSTVGFEGATTRSIAARAQVQHGLVIYHFQSKLGVWQAVMERTIGEFHQQFIVRLEALKPRDAETKLRALNRWFIEFSAAHPELNWMISREASAGSDRLKWILDVIKDHDVNVTVELISELQAAGRYVEGDPAHLHFTFLGAVARVFNLAPEIEARTGISAFSREFIERHVELCERLFFREPSQKH